MSEVDSFPQDFDVCTKSETTQSKKPVDKQQREGQAKKISQDRKQEDKDDEKVVERVFKKAMKDLKEQLDGSSGEEKIKILERKYLEKLKEFNKLDRSNSRLQQMFESLQTDMENISQELSRTKNVKDKLEALCKQLQKQNQSIFDEYKKAAIDDKERKKEQQQKFSVMIQEVQAKIESHDQERRQQIVENEKLREQLQSFITQYEERDKHFEAQIHIKSTEKAIAEEKQAKAEELCRQALNDAELYRKKSEEHSSKELGLREEMCSYSEKYKEFQESISKSNEAFADFKKDSEKMTKKIRTLEKEKRELQIKKDASDAAVREATESLEAVRREGQALTKQRERMEGLCRTLIVERTSLRARLGLESEEPAEGATAGAGGPTEAGSDSAGRGAACAAPSC